MSNILPLLLNQKCTYWPKGVVDSFGQYSPGVSVELDCKWTNYKSEVVSKEGKVHSTNAMVYLSTQVQVDGWIWLGKQVDAPIMPSDPSSGAYVIRKVDVTNDTENEETLYVASVG